MKKDNKKITIALHCGFLGFIGLSLSFMFFQLYFCPICISFWLFAFFYLKKAYDWFALAVF